MNVKEASQRSAAWLQERGISGARLDAELLLAHVLGCERIHLFVAPDRPLSDEERDRYRELIRRRGEHEPVAYLVGSAGFWDIDVKVDGRALIPRPETEKIIELALAAAGPSRDQALRIVDVGCGSGVLAITLAKAFPHAQVVALDISQDALDLTAENATLNGVRDRVHPVRSDLLGALIQKGSRADLIVSNPPYIGERERSLMSPGVERYEPTLALFAGDDGFDVIDRLLPQIPQVLANGGLFLMEFGSPQGASIRDRAGRRFRSWRVEKDWSGHDRVLVVDGPGDRLWASAPAMVDAAAGAAPLGADGSSESAGLAPGASESGVQTPEGFAQSFQDTHSFNVNGRYGGADGTELLPEIDLHEDLEDV